MALVTPMKPDGAIDEQQLRDILRWHVACETDGVVVLGTTGEVCLLAPSSYTSLGFWVRRCPDR